MAESKKKQEKILVSQNKKAFHDFFIMDRYEAGIALIGCEVKSIREHKVNLKDSFARIKNGEVLVFNMHISPYANSRTEEINPTRVRKLLLHRREIDRIISKLKDKSITLVPISVYLDRGLVKIELATAKGKLKSDKRQDLEKKESELEIKRALKNRNRQYRNK